MRLTNLSPSCADCNEIWVHKPTGILRACAGLYRDCPTTCIEGDADTRSIISLHTATFLLPISLLTNRIYIYDLLISFVIIIVIFVFSADYVPLIYC